MLRLLNVSLCWLSCETEVLCAAFFLMNVWENGLLTSTTANLKHVNCWVTWQLEGLPWGLRRGKGLMKWQQPGLEGNEEGEGQVEGGKEGRGESIFQSTVEPVNAGFTVRLCERNSLSFSCPLHTHTYTHTCKRIHSHTHTMSFSHSAGCWQWLFGSRAWRHRTKALSLLSLGLEPTNARLLIRTDYI